jgi:mono/diheme cytochrome c family protein
MFKRTALVALIAAATTAAAYLAAPQTTAQEHSVRVKRGEYLVNTSGCHDCHTPWKMGEKGPEPDMSLALSGHPQDLKMPPAPKLEMPWAWAGGATNTAFAGPWGISYARNLTSDEMTGLGGWPEEMFINAIRRGRHRGAGRPILPPMPWPVYRNLTDEDLKSIYAYLQTVPAVSNQVPEAQIAAPPPVETAAAAPAKQAR